MRAASRFLVGTLVLVGCSAASSQDDDASEEESSTGGGDDDVSAIESSEGESSEGGTGEESSSESSGEETGEPSAPSTCDPWAQDCPETEKCMPYEADPVDMLVWDALGCFPLEPPEKRRR